MWRIEVTEIGRTPLPPIDLDSDEVVIGSGEGCQLRLPARSVRARHLLLSRKVARPLRMGWRAEAEVEIDGVRRQAGERGESEEAMVAVLGGYRLQITEAAPASIPTSPQRTESLVREMIRTIMGGAAPRLLVEEGPEVNSSRTLAPPNSRLTVGRGDEADWVILDEDLSRVHAAIKRTWDGVSIVDLGSKNGTRVDGEPVPPGEEGRVLRDGARIALGDVVMRYRDDAETYLSQAEDGAGAGPDAADGVTGGLGSEAAASLAAASRPPPKEGKAAKASISPSVSPSKTPQKTPALRPPTTPPRPRPPTAPPIASAPSAASAASPTSSSGAASSSSPLLVGVGVAVVAGAIAAAAWLLGG